MEFIKKASTDGKAGTHAEDYQCLLKVFGDSVLTKHNTAGESKREEHYKTKPREEAGPQGLQKAEFEILQLPRRGTSPALVPASSRVVSRPKSSVTPAALNIANPSTIAPAVSSADTDLSGPSLGTAAPSLPPARPSPPSITSSDNLLGLKIMSASPAPYAAMPTPSVGRLSKDSVLALLGPKPGTSPAPPEPNKFGQLENLQASPNSAYNSPNQQQQFQTQPTKNPTRISSSGCTPYLPGAVCQRTTDQGASEAAIGNWDILNLEIRVGEYLSAGLVSWVEQGPEMKKLVNGNKAFADQLLDHQQSVEEVGILCHAKANTTQLPHSAVEGGTAHSPTDAASLCQRSSPGNGREDRNFSTSKGQGPPATRVSASQAAQNTPNSQYADPKEDNTGYLPGVASRDTISDTLPLSLGTSSSFGPPTARHYPGHSSHQQTRRPEDRNTKDVNMNLHPARRVLSKSKQKTILAGYHPSFPWAAQDTLTVEMFNAELVVWRVTSRMVQGELKATKLVVWRVTSRNVQEEMKATKEARVQLNAAVIACPLQTCRHDHWGQQDQRRGHLREDWKFC